MRRKSSRLLPAMITTAVASLAFLAPASASAAPHCLEGANVHGEGATIVSEAMANYFVPSFNTSAAKTACNGTQGAKGKPKVSWTKLSAATAMEKWGYNKGTRTNSTDDFIVTSDPPNETQIAEEETENGELFSGAHLETIPIVQVSMALLVHLPAGCSVTSTAPGNTGRFVFTQEQLQQVEAGEITAWNQITGGAADKYKNVWTGESCGNTIKRLVRQDGTGATAILQKYLNLINPTPAEYGGKTWAEVAESGVNNQWPNSVADPVTTEIGGKKVESSSYLAESVQKNAGYIGYAGLADARKAHIAGTVAERSVNGQEGASIFWPEIQNSGGVNNPKAPKFAEPAATTASGEGSYNSGSKTTANCASEVYTDGVNTLQKFPPENTHLPWNTVTTSTTEKKYGICGLGYIQAYDHYSLLTGFNESHVGTVSDFLNFVLGTAATEGQGLIKTKSDFLPLPASALASQNVIGIAKIGAAQVGF